MHATLAIVLLSHPPTKLMTPRFILLKSVLLLLLLFCSLLLLLLLLLRIADDDAQFEKAKKKILN